MHPEHHFVFNVLSYCRLGGRGAAPFYCPWVEWWFFLILSDWTQHTWEKTLSYTFYLSPQVIRRQETFISAASVDWKHWEWATSSLPFKAPFWHHRVRELSTCSSLIPFSLQVQRSSCNSGFCSSLSGLLLSHLIIYWNLHSYIFYICAALFAAKAIFCVKMIDWILRQIQRQKRILRAMQKDEGNLRWGLSKTVVWRFLSRTDWVQSSGAEGFKSYQNL